MLLVLAFVAQAAAVAPAPPALAPAGKWVIEYEPNMCVLSRAFGTADAPITLAIKPNPGDTTGEVILITQAVGGQAFREGSGEIVATPGGLVKKGDYSSAVTIDGKLRLARYWVEGNAFDALRVAETLAIYGEKDGAVTLRSRSLGKALDALKTCQDGLMERWGISKADRDAIAKPATDAGDPAYWLTVDDYPVQALKAGIQGEVQMLWTIGPNGRVSDCRIIKSAGHEALDRAACNAITKRGRYKPARDQQNNPVRSWASRRVIWQLPR